MLLILLGFRSCSASGQINGATSHGTFGMTRFLTILVFATCLPWVGAMGASIKIKNCYPDSAIDIKLFNGKDVVRIAPSSSSVGVAYRQSRISSCGTDTCRATIGYVKGNAASSGGLAAAYGTGMRTAVFSHELDETKTYCFDVLDSGQSRLGWSNCC